MDPKVWWTSSAVSGLLATGLASRAFADGVVTPLGWLVLALAIASLASAAVASLGDGSVSRRAT